MLIKYRVISFLLTVFTSGNLAEGRLSHLPFISGRVDCIAASIAFISRQK